MKWNEMEWNGMEWNGMEWNEMEWNESGNLMLLYIISRYHECNPT